MHLFHHFPALLITGVSAGTQCMYFQANMRLLKSFALTLALTAN